MMVRRGGGIYWLFALEGERRPVVAAGQGGGGLPRRSVSEAITQEATGERRYVVAVRPAGFRVLSCQPSPLGVRQVVVMQSVDEHARPRCGVVVSGRPYDRPESRIKDLPFGQRPLEVIWRERRYRCLEPACPQRVFTQRSEQVPPRIGSPGGRAPGSSRPPGLGADAGRRRRGVRRVVMERAPGAGRCGPRAGCGAAAADADAGPGRDPARSVRWIWSDQGTRAGWRLSNPWMTSFVDLDTGRPGWLLGLVPGRSRAAVGSWLAKQPQSWRDGAEVVALNPSAPFAAAIRRVLPNAALVVDHFHLVRLANQALTEVRQRVAREQLGRRGRKPDPAWAHRRLLLRRGPVQQARPGPAQARPRYR